MVCVALFPCRRGVTAAPREHLPPMKSYLRFGLRAVGALAALLSFAARADVVEFRATINAAQETNGSTSPATGWAVLLYDVAANEFDLTVTINNLANTITMSHIHEAAPGVAGPVVTDLGSEAAVYSRDGTTLTATFRGKTHGGTPLTLLQNGAYLNFHSAAYPSGEVRGQLIAQPKRLYAVLNNAQEVPATSSTAYGAAYITYDPGTNKITTRVNLYNFVNTLTNSHYHEALPGVPGPVAHGLGGANVYTQTDTSYGAVFANQTYGGDPIKLLTGGTYLNVHSNVNAPGEIRGQVWASDDLEVSRLVGLSARGHVGTGEQVLINGFVISGDEPLRVLITARGPSLAATGVTTVLNNPILSLHDSTGRRILVNDNYGTAFAAAEMPATGLAPSSANESAVLLVLPPGAYTTVVSGAEGAMGVALTEVFEVRPPASAPQTAESTTFRGQRRLRAPTLAKHTETPVRRVLEICGAPLLARLEQK